MPNKIFIRALSIMNALIKNVVVYWSTIKSQRLQKRSNSAITVTPVLSYK